MECIKIEYTHKTATENKIYQHLIDCNFNFIPKLEDTVNIKDYASKLCNKAITFEAWSNNDLVGLVAAYFNDFINHTGYITYVSTIKQCMGKGIANVLLNNCIDYAKANGFNQINLEVHKNNNMAIKLYNKFGFSQVSNNGDFTIMKLICI